MVLNESVATSCFAQKYFRKKTLAPCCGERGLKERTGSVRRGVDQFSEGLFCPELSPRLVIYDTWNWRKLSHKHHYC